MDWARPDLGGSNIDVAWSEAQVCGGGGVWSAKHDGGVVATSSDRLWLYM